MIITIAEMKLSRFMTYAVFIFVSKKFNLFQMISIYPIITIPRII